MHAGGISLPCDVHLIDVVGGVSGEERVIGILQNRQKSECQSELAFTPEMETKPKKSVDDTCAGELLTTPSAGAA